ncbi:MAG: hypothetical protein VB045_02650 [Synergistaceae bacterium]|nr:hypothetical protein [Synergistaceae bacterium]
MSRPSAPFDWSGDRRLQLPWHETIIYETHVSGGTAGDVSFLVPGADFSARSFVACLQNHDQVGNRALGERTARLLNKGQLMIGAALVLTSPYVPLLFQGEEGGFLSLSLLQRPWRTGSCRRDTKGKAQGIHPLLQGGRALRRSLPALTGSGKIAGRTAKGPRVFTRPRRSPLIPPGKCSGTREAES